jgi:hypothetical protein
MQQGQGWLDKASGQKSSVPLRPAGKPPVDNGTADDGSAGHAAAPDSAARDEPGASNAMTKGELASTASSPLASIDSPSVRPDKFRLETRLIELGAAMAAAQLQFKSLERDFYLAAFGRYDE